MTSWAYSGDDPGISLFSASMRAGAPMTFTPGMKVLEVGCCESDWLERAARTWPECLFVGVDARATNGEALDGRITRYRLDVIYDRFDPESFDAVVSLSAIEHIGLGHYGDPLDPDGDTKAIANGWRWLKPGGWLYFDVPYSPAGYRVAGTEYRLYDDDARWTRLWQEPLAQATARAQWLWEGYSTAKEASVLVAKPTRPVTPFHYAAVVWKKAG